jgi:CheY-like chemotaxis protein
VESQNTHYSIEFTISDNGIGMSEKTCSDVLDSFWFHLDDLNISINSESDLQSSGLGLAIAQKLSQLMNGDLWVKLSELNQGSIFVFNIIASEDEYPEYIDHLSLKNIKNKHAIVVDTDSSVRVKLYNTLSKWGMECTLASSADEVTLAHLKNTRPIHIMFIKDQLLKTKGTELAKIIRSQGFQFPIVIITLAIENITTDSVVNAVLVSPIDEKDLMTTTIQLLSTKEHKADIRDCEILIAEDDKSNQIVIEKILRRAGNSKITITNNGGEAYDEIQRNPYKYEVVLIDIRMPVIDGIKLSHLIYDMYQTLGNPESMPFMIGVSAQPIMDTSSIGKMQAFVAKPIVVKQLEEYINNRKLYMGRQSV